MYKLLLVDDEDFVLNGLQRLIQSLIQTKGIPVSQIRTARNGLEAIEIMEDYPADVILTDIKMPGMDGIELIERMASKNHNCKIIILSGFDSFEYAQKAIANNIKAYLLKPVKRVDLETALEKVLDELTQENGQSEYIRKLEEQLAADLPLLREKFFFELSNGNYQKDLADFLQLDFTDKAYQIILVAADSFKSNDFSQIALEKDKQLTLLQLSNQLRDSMDGLIKCAPFQLHHRICALLCLAPGQNNAYLERCLKSYQLRLQQVCDISCSVGVSQSFQKVADFSIHLEEAYAALKQRLLLGSQALVFYTDIFPWQNQQASSVLYENNNKLKYNIYHALRAGQKEKTLTALHQYKKQLLQIPYCPLELMRTLSTDLVTAFTMFAFEQNIDTKQLLYAGRSPGEAILLSSTLDDIFNVLENTACCIFDCISEKSQAETISTIRRIKKYVWTHISEDPTLETLSEVVFLTPNYISTLFKKETGISFKDYVTETKIQKAKELLKSNQLKIQDVAQAVGYHSTPYFSKTFKRVTGMYPSEYRVEIGASSEISDF